MNKIKYLVKLLSSKDIYVRLSLFTASFFMAYPLFLIVFNLREPLKFFCFWAGVDALTGISQALTSIFCIRYNVTDDFSVDRAYFLVTLVLALVLILFVNLL